MPHTEIIARGLATHGSRVLLCRNLKHGYLYLPGGHVEFAEPAAHALARELLEETGLTARIGPPLLITEQSFTDHKARPHHELNLVFHVEQLIPPDSDGAEGSQPSVAAKPRAAVPDGAGAAQDPPPTIPSLEPGIAFEWVDLAAIPDLDVRPAEVQAWLAAGGRVGPPAVGWLSACGPAIP